MVTGIAYYLVVLIVIAAIVAIVLAVVKHFGIAVPPLVIQIFWIVFGCALAVIAIKFIVTLI